MADASMPDILPESGEVPVVQQKTIIQQMSGQLPIPEQQRSLPDKPDAYDGVHATVMVRANDNNTKVITGEQSMSYKKGYFVCCVDHKGAHQLFYGMKYSGSEW